MLSQLRFPGAKPSLIAFLLLLPLLWLFAKPSGSHGSGVGGLAGEMLVAAGTLGLAVIVIVVTFVLVTRNSPALTWMYPWMALAIVAGNAVLWTLGYWREAAESRDLHYALAPWLALTSVAALAPACVGPIVHVVRRR